MKARDVLECSDLFMPADRPFPTEVDFVISALEAGPHPPVDRHRHRRTRYRVRAMLRLFSDGDGAPPILLYTRSISSQALGFLCTRQVPLSHGGIMLIPRRDGTINEVACTILRCRQAAPAWYEGALHFNRPQRCFAAEEMNLAEFPALA
jgi:hypothetical protein